MIETFFSSFTYFIFCVFCVYVACFLAWFIICTSIILLEKRLGMFTPLVIIAVYLSIAMAVREVILVGRGMPCQLCWG